MLQENYPFVDPLALDALFEANNYNYSHTVTALDASLGTKPQPPKVQIVSANPTITKEETQARTPVIFFLDFKKFVGSCNALMHSCVIQFVET